MAKGNRETDRRGFLVDGLRVAGAFGLAGAAGWWARSSQAEDAVWQIDPDRCIACGICQTHCVLDPSAVKCVQCFEMCGYCDVCTGYFPTTDFELNTAAENQLCPTAAIIREYIEEQPGVRYFEYTINESLCIACGKCVEGCALMNGSLYLQVRHDLCVNCNECAIAVECPAQAFRRVPASHPTLLKREAVEALRSRQRRLADRDPADQVRQKVDELLEKDAREIIDRGAQQG